MAQPTVLISGAGVAGPALTHWLARDGYRVVIVEAAPNIRPGGQTVDLRGAGREVVTRMGLLPAMTERCLFQRGIAWVRADGTRRAEMPVEAFGGNGIVSALEILRGDLADVLYQATSDVAEYRFGTRVSVLEEDESGVRATLTDGSVVEADLVVGADGPHSAVRQLAFGPEERFIRRLGGYNAWFTAPDMIGLDGWYLMFQAAGGLNASLRPSHDESSAKAGLAFRSEPIEYDRRDLDAQRALLAERFRDAGWYCDELLRAAAQSDDFYFDDFVQVHMDTWSAGRVTLCGDAGYCASPLSGMGTSLALVGAYVLAGELGPAAAFDAAGIAAALRRYEAVMRPYVDRCQDLPGGLDGYAPMTERQIAGAASAMKWVQRWPLRPWAARKWFSTAESIDLPDYRS
ncbi:MULTISPECIES: FAD-dependent monooxygenase [Mycobacteriaceae]|uniref:FAD-binding monooxygenase n=1 Tax=Mycolicibacterium mucogenicum DSM 44124 TaxID=1226753 RepID=A0A8H2PGY0_MYCMU|nr:MULTISPECIES: FAD-dependent monooxygenase [Mycobacteriaceae]KAB7758366.1 FAD-binding monooxygenase [Mycolicibacterium mucogenicum DSM 44124]QPG71793.1 FAD-dependent monooxygenase [Mycolicibacterium mucogenicum DSM 44124]